MLIIWSSLYVDQISWECKSYNVDIYWKEQPRCNSDKEMKIWWKLIISHLWDIFAEISGHIYTKNLVVCLLGFLFIWEVLMISISSMWSVGFDWSISVLSLLPYFPSNISSFYNPSQSIAPTTIPFSTSSATLHATLRISIKTGRWGEVGAANWQQGKNSTSSSCDNHKSKKNVRSRTLPASD